MQQLKHLFSRRCYRYYPFWLLSLISVYTLAGFVLAPYLIQKTIVEQVQVHLGWEAKIERVEVNPYSLSLRIEQLKINDLEQKEVMGFTRLYTDFTLRSVFEWALTFENIELIDPHFDFTLNKDGTNNISRALDDNAIDNEQVEDVTAEPNDNTESSLIPLLFDNIKVQNGALRVTNHQPKTTVEHQVKPITFNLDNFSTRLNEEGQYQLDIALGTGQELHWKGGVSLNPIHSSGTIDISGIKAHKFWPYVQELVPYQLEHAIASVTGEYAVSLLAGELALKIQKGSLDIKQIKVASEQLKDGFLDIGHVNIGPANFDLQEKNLAITQVGIDKLVLNVLRDAEGQLTMLMPLSEMSGNQAKDSKDVTTPTTSVKASSQNEFKWAINKIAMKNSQVNWLDKQPQPEASISINNINVELNKLNQNLASTLPFSVNYLVNKSQKNTVLGELSINPLKLDSNLKLAAIDLTIAQPYINQAVNINLQKGLIFADLDVQLSQNKEKEMVANVDGGLHVKEFSTQDKLLNKHLVGWQALSIEPMKISLNPLAVDIEKITLSKLDFRMNIAKDGRTNIASLAVKDKNNTVKDEPDVAAHKKEQAAPVPIRIGEVSLNEGRVNFSDLTFNPQFNSDISHINGHIRGLSSDVSKNASVDIKGKIEEYGSMLIKGEINPFSNELYSDIGVKFDRIELSPMSPYSGRYVGYAIDKGKLKLDLHYKIKHRLLVAQNRVIMNQFDFGEYVESKEASSLPIKFAMELFKDKNGVIDIALPVSGDLDDPSFKVSTILLKTFSNLIVRAAASPFSAIAGLTNSHAGELNEIPFELGSSELSNEQKEKLKTVADILKKRPKLVLGIRAMVDKKSDSNGLKVKQLLAELSESDVDITDQNELLEAKEELYITQHSQQALDDLGKRIENEIKVESEKSSKSWSDDEVEATQVKRLDVALTEALIASQSSTNLPLSTLAKQRLRAVKNELMKVNKVPHAQVFTLKSSLSGVAEGEFVVSELSLK